MYEIDLSTLILIGMNDEATRVITSENDFVVKTDSKSIINNSCKFFGSNMADRLKMTNRLINIKELRLRKSIFLFHIIDIINTAFNMLYLFFL